MISEKDLAEFEKVPYDERISRIEKMIAEKDSPRGFELGLLLALKMGQEIREKKPLGSISGDLVASWDGKYSEYVIEEAIASAKEFMLHPGAIAEKIKAGMNKFDKTAPAEEDAPDATQDNAGQQDASSEEQNG